MLDFKGAQKDATRSLNHRMELWDPKGKTVRDKLGADKLEPAKIADVWADMTVIRGKETSGKENRVIAYTSTRITIRYRENIRPDMYLVENGRRFDIEAIKPLGNKLYLSLECQERVI